MKWTRTVLPGWNEVEYTDSTGRYTVRRMMMSATRPGCWKAQWALFDARQVTSRPIDFFDTLRDAKDRVTP